jgi:restriction endonuclease Mrr
MAGRSRRADQLHRAVHSRFTLQAEAVDRTIAGPDIQQFSGVLQGQRARKGVFISTSSFSARRRNTRSASTPASFSSTAPSWRS